MRRRRTPPPARSRGCEPDQAQNFDELFQRGFRYALALTHEPDRAADLLQDACVACLSAKAPWRVGYLFAAIRSRCIDQYRRQLRGNGLVRLIRLPPRIGPGETAGIRITIPGMEPMTPSQPSRGLCSSY